MNQIFGVLVTYIVVFIDKKRYPKMDNSPEEQYRCPAPRDQCVMNGDYEFYVYNSVPSNSETIEFRTVPFHRIINQVLPPMCIRFQPIMAVAGPNNVCNRVGAQFFLSLSDVQQICQPNRVPGGRKQPIQLQIRLGERLPEMNELSEELPQPMQMWINSKQIPMNDIKSPLNLNAIDYLHLNTVNINTITIFWPQCKRQYYMVVNLVDIIGVEELVTDIKMDNDRFFLALDTKKTASDFLKKSDKDLDLAAYKLTLLCPINKLKMKFPAKSVKCNHLECFDLQAFISLNKMEPTWMCPICMKPCILDDLKIDSFLLFVINSINVPKTCVEIEFYANGKWKPYSDSRESILESTSCGPSEKKILEIDLGNSDDENLDDFGKTVLPITNAGNSNDLKRNICMDTTTLKTNTEENPPLIKIIKKEETND